MSNNLKIQSPFKGPNYRSDRMRRNDTYQPVIINESLLTDDHRDICKHFGCGKELHGYELLCGKCFGCQNKKAIDPNKHVNI